MFSKACAGTYGGAEPILYNLDGFEPEPALPVLAETQMTRIPVDPSVGFATGRINPDMDGSVAYFITEGIYFVLVLSTDEGVVLVDAPPSMAATLVAGVKAIAGDDAVVTHLVYSHAHQDHISGAAAVLDAYPDAEVRPVSPALRRICICGLPPHLSCTPAHISCTPLMHTRAGPHAQLCFRLSDSNVLTSHVR